MIRETDLVSYLPPFVAEFGEISAALKAENPEFTLVWDGAARVLRNEFIETADEHGILRFEKMLGIIPEPDDSLEGRRARIARQWLVELPYTLRTLIKKLISICGDSSFTIETDFDHYRIKVETAFDFVGQTKEVEALLEHMVPSNIVIGSENRISANSDGGFFTGGAVLQKAHITINSELAERIAASGQAQYGSCISDHRSVFAETASYIER